MAMELAWGVLRRAGLRTFFPGHVRRMASLRQGDLAGCPVPVIDSRDLKYYRNVCTAHFPWEVDPFFWREETGLARAGLAEVALFSLLLGCLTAGTAHLAYWVHPLWMVLMPVWLTFWAFLFWFFRDPQRVIPADPSALVSPADGRVTHVEEVMDPDFSGGKALRISIFLSVFNVHVNRIPRQGKVIDLRYFPGAYLDARNSECAVRNEQFWIDMVDGPSGGRIRIKQIAGAIARRIVCWLRPGEEVQRGARLGMIKFGSRTDLLIDQALVAKVLVQVGTRVQGGTTRLLEIRSTTDSNP